MSEEQILDPGLEVPGGAPADKKVEVSSEGKKEPKEDQARGMGWKSLEEWTEDGHDPDDHVTAKEYVARESFFKKISAQNRELSALRATVEEQRNFQGILFEEAKKKAMTELRAQHRQAVEDGNLERADKLVEEIAEKAKEPTAPRTSAPAGPDPLVQEWMETNDWYMKDDVKQSYANAQGAVFINNYRAQYGRMPAPLEVLQHVEKVVKTRWGAEKKVVQGPGSSPEGAPSRGKRSNTGLAEADLSDTEVNIMNDLVRRGEMTKEKYLASMASLKKGNK